MGKKKTPTPQQANTDIYNRSVTQYNNAQQPSALENEFTPISQNFMNNYNRSVEQDTADRANIMGGFQNYMKNAKFSFKPVTAERPAELGEAYGYLREAMPGYREFASTGGYSPQDIQELRARSTNPVRAAYGNTMMELNRARSLGGNGGATNYIAAASRAQRDLPQQLADAQTNINAQLADQIRQGRLAGLSGIESVGGKIGGLSSDEAGRQLQAALANQGADLQTQQMANAAQQFGLSGQAGLYGTTPGMSSMFGNQALSAYNARLGMEQARNQFGLSALDAQLRSQQLAQQNPKQPWWQTALGVAGTVAPYVALAASDKNIKHDIKSVGRGTTSKMAKYLKDLPLKKWKYNGDDTTHFGPMAQDFKRIFGIGDGKTLHLADVMGVVLATAKEETANA